MLEPSSMTNMRSDSVVVFNLHLQSDFTLFIAENPLSHSAVEAGIVKTKSIRLRRFGYWSPWDLFRSFHVFF